MCNNLTPAATALLAALLVVASPALADSGGKPAPTAAPQTPAASTASKPASAQDRAAADRLEPLARAAFWSNELSKNPADAEAGVRLAVALRQLGHAQEAYNTLQQVLALQPDNAEALLETARAAIAGNQGFYAIAPAKKAQALKPKDWRAPSLLGVAYEQTRQPELALAAHRQAVALAPNNSAALCNLGMFLAANGDPAQGESLLRKAAALPDASTQVRQDLALILGLQGKLAESEQLQRQDLPPDQADNNVAYLKAAATPATAASPAPQGAAAASDRSWSALAKAQDQTPIN
jgi:Flp pilus assembly protein TadD